MKKLFLILLILSTSIFAQNKIFVTVADSVNHSPLVGANVFLAELQTGGATNVNGKVTLGNIPAGNFILTVSYVGYKSQKINVKFTGKNSVKKIKIFLAPKAIKSNQVIITSTRTNGAADDSPIKVEVLGLDEVNEEIGIRPGNISKLLSETSGVIVRQLSQISGTVSFRLQGLPGQYTQLCIDGMPAPAALSSGLTLLQIPPLDLEQVEVVKGPSSVFYGNGAVAGFVNLVTRNPATNGGLELLLNRTSRKGTDLSSFYSNKFNNLGVTVLTSFSKQSAVDVAGNGFTDIPAFTQFNIVPKLFWNIDNKSNLEFGINAFYENRVGGDIYAVDNGSNFAHPFFERNKSNRYGALLKYNRKLSLNSEVNFNSNFSYYNRNSSLPNSYFSGKNLTGFSEFSLLKEVGAHKVVAGINFSKNYFKETDGSRNDFYNYDNSIWGVFVQDDWKISKKFIVQPALRVDLMKSFSPVYLPHISLMYKLTDNFLTRVSLGSGYKVPTVFDIDIDPHAILGHMLAPAGRIERETANGINLDFNYKLIVDEFVMKINQSFYYTEVGNSLAIRSADPNDYPSLLFYNGATLKSKGFDTNLYLALDELEFFADYSFTDVSKTVEEETKPLFFTPRNKLNLTVTYEEEGSWRTGAEAFYTGKQYLESDDYSRAYWLFGVMFEKYFSNFSVILNVENLTDERQSKYEKIVEGVVTNPSFKDIYMPIDGIVGNIAVRIKID